MIALLIGVTAAEAGAQDTLVTTKCAGQRISSITIRSSAPSVLIFRRTKALADIANTVHHTTDPELINRFLLLHQGDKCDELRRADSERILRAQPFISAAQIQVWPDSGGEVSLDVKTTDEVALVLGLGLAGGSGSLVRLVRLGDANINGQGLFLAGTWVSGGPFRDGYGGRFVDNQLLGHPYTFTTEAFQNPLGNSWIADATHPFYTDLQRFAWRGLGGGLDDYVQYRNNDTSTHALRVARDYFDLGGIVRIGAPGRLSLFGASISGEDERPAATPVLITPNGFAQDTSTALVNRFVAHRIARANILWGIRDIGFAPVVGFDALTATQDLPVGFQLGTMFGRSLSVLGSRDDDLFLAGDLYLGAVGRNNGIRVQVEGEGRRDNDSGGDWDGILMTSRAVQYFKPTISNTSTLSVEFSGGWNQRLPFNLTLSDRDGGLRGYSYSNTPGAQRFVVRLEDRQFVGRPNNWGDFGVGAFAESGRLWAGDIPYGVNTGMHSAIGVSLLGAVPVASARLWRLDFAWAVNPEGYGHHFEIRFGNTDKTTFFLAEPADIEATRERTVPSSIFRWPR